MSEAKGNGRGALTLILAATTLIGATVSIMLATWGGPRQDNRLSRVDAAAVAAGLKVGDLYRIGDTVGVVHA
jgi:hypothetical protein